MGRVALAVAAGAAAGLDVGGNAGLTAALAGLFAVGVAAGVGAGCAVGTAGAGLAEAADICSPLSKINADIKIDFDINLGVNSDAAFRAARVGDRLKAAPAETD